MITYIGLFLGLGLSLYLVQLIRSFGYMSVAELRRRTDQGDLEAAKVHKARVHGIQIWVVLWGLLGLSLAGVILILDRLLPLWISLPLDVVLIVTMHVILPWARWPRPSLRLASHVGPVLGFLLYKSQPLLKGLDSLFGSWVEIEATQRIHSKEELLENLQKLPGELDKVGKDELRIAQHALTFGEKCIADVMTPKSVMRTVDELDVLTPVMRGELHDTGFSRFPVTSEEDDYIGVLYLKDTTRMTKNDSVNKLMRPEVYYVNVDTNLDQVLNAFLRTQHHLFIVVNQYEEAVGVISIEDVLEQIIGKSIVDEFDQYEDLRAVAKQRADERARDRSKKGQQHIEKEK
ncbi:MAG: CBS domain-containing protein [Patescibacteria group bacterium]